MKTFCYIFRIVATLWLIALVVWLVVRIDRRRPMESKLEVLEYKVPVMRTANLHIGNPTASIDVLPHHLFISNDGKKTGVDIDLETGRVRYKGFTPDRASMIFWDGVVTAFPNIREKIIKEYLEQKKDKK